MEAFSIKLTNYSDRRNQKGRSKDAFSPNHEGHSNYTGEGWKVASFQQNEPKVS